MENQEPAVVFELRLTIKDSLLWLMRDALYLLIRVILSELPQCTHSLRRSRNRI